MVSTVNGEVALRGDPKELDGRKEWDEAVAQVHVMLLLHGRVEIRGAPSPPCFREHLALLLHATTCTFRPSRTFEYNASLS